MDGQLISEREVKQKIFFGKHTISSNRKTSLKKTDDGKEVVNRISAEFLYSEYVRRCGR